MNKTYIDEIYDLLSYREYVHPNINDKEQLLIIFSQTEETCKAELRIKYNEREFLLNEIGVGNSFEEAAKCLSTKIKLIIEQIKEKNFEIECVLESIVRQQSENKMIEKEREMLIERLKGVSF